MPPAAGGPPRASACGCCTSTPIPTTSRARVRRRTAKYVAEGVEVVVATCTGGERGSILNPAMDRPDVLANIGDDPAGRDGPGAGDPRHRAGLARLRRLRACPRATRCRRCPTAASPRSTSRGRGRAAGQGHPRVPAARDDHVRRERRLPAPRPHHVPQDQRRGVRRGRRPGRLPRAGRAVAGAQAVLLLHLPPRPDGRPGPGDDRARAGVAVRRAAGGLAGRSGAGGPDHHPGAVRGLLRRPGPGAARPRDPGRSGGTLVLGAAGDAQDASGRPRTGSWCAAWSTRQLPEDDLFAGIAVPAERGRLASAEVGRVSA